MFWWQKLAQILTSRDALPKEISQVSDGSPSKNSCEGNFVLFCFGVTFKVLARVVLISFIEIDIWHHLKFPL